MAVIAATMTALHRADPFTGAVVAWVLYRSGKSSRARSIFTGPDRTLPSDPDYTQVARNAAARG